MKNGFSIKILFLVIPMLLMSCGGSDPLGDESGFSTFEIENASNYTLSVECTTQGYSDCNEILIAPGESLVVGVYGEIGVMPGPLPENIFEEMSVYYDVNDGEYAFGLNIDPTHWVVMEETDNSITYSTTILDADLLARQL